MFNISLNPKEQHYTEDHRTILKQLSIDSKYINPLYVCVILIACRKKKNIWREEFSYVPNKRIQHLYAISSLKVVNFAMR